MSRGRKRTWSDEQFVQAVKESENYTQVIIKLGLRPAGGNGETVRTNITRLGLDTQHFTNTSQLRGLREHVQKHTWTDDEVFCRKSQANRRMVRMRLLKHGMKYVCNECDQTPMFRGKPLTLQLDHINGVWNDHRVENLRFLCPNCHSQTETFCGRNGWATGE
jgi:hypothetical protein